MNMVTRKEKELGYTAKDRRCDLCNDWIYPDDSYLKKGPMIYHSKCYTEWKKGGR